MLDIVPKNDIDTPSPAFLHDYVTKNMCCEEYGKNSGNPVITCLLVLKLVTIT